MYIQIRASTCLYILQTFVHTERKNSIPLEMQIESSAYRFPSGEKEI